jgi:hypothetical protein
MLRIILLTIVPLLGACEGPYTDLSAAFPAAASAPVDPLPAGRLLLVSTRHKGAFTYGEGSVDIKLMPDGIEMRPAFPLSVAMPPVFIPVAKIDGCSRTCFGDGVWDANLLVSATGTEISLPRSRAIVDWCWERKIPMIPAADRRAWLYTGTALPNKSKFSEQLASREKFDYQAKQSCLGY